ncbi:hypothetical protein ABLE93_15700 [Xanthobacter sp. KR7-65]|uniref:hypothetical protein n=1 Tax=Xanthobacter sp. KR7-65 TaxID=3156612 RepID=UPI0032B58794
MADDTVPRPVIVGAETAPIAYFEGVSAIGHQKGIYSVGLCVGRPVGFTDGAVPTIVTAVAVLKGNREALELLRRAIDDALLIGAPVQGEAN